MPDIPMEGVTVKELWMLLGEKDVQIYQLLKHIEDLNVCIEGYEAPGNQGKNDGGLGKPTTEHSVRDIPK